METSIVGTLRERGEVVGGLWDLLGMLMLTGKGVLVVRGLVVVVVG